MVPVDFHHDKAQVQTIETAWEQGHTLGILRDTSCNP